MESNLVKSPKLGHTAESSDTKYISGLSTILVATIQEAKDRISQVEYIFCDQLFPKFQLNQPSLQKIYSEAREAAEHAYKAKEKDMLLQIKSLQHQKQQLLEENLLLKSENAKFITMEKESCDYLQELQELKQKTVEINEVREASLNLQKTLESNSALLQRYEMSIKELSNKYSMCRDTMSKLLVETKELQLELLKKVEEIDEEKLSKNELLQANQLNASLIAQKEVQLKEYEIKINGLITKLTNMESKVNELLSVVKDKTAEVCQAKELQENLLRKIEFQSSELVSNEQLLDRYEKENRLLKAKLQSLNALLIEKKSSELQKDQKEQEHLLQQCDSSNSERIKREQEHVEFEEEREQLLDKQKNLLEEVEKLQQSLSERIKQIEAKDFELQTERRKLREAVVSYKRLKSQYNYLLKKFGLSQDNMLTMSHDNMENENEIIRGDRVPVPSPDIESKSSGFTVGVIKPVDEVEASDYTKGFTSIQRSRPVSPSASTVVKCPKGTKSCPSAGAKRPSSYWRDTRSHQSRAGPDLHDDFLDTPLEIVKENLEKASKEHLPDLSKSIPRDMSLNYSDDETQDMKVDAEPQTLRMSPPKAIKSNYKYVEPVRKKFDRENLKGIECKQCKKFYDAVFPDGTKNSNNDKQNIRCEHHAGVSRHRYRYAPPLTPEGFWNIGFESET